MTPESYLAKQPPERRDALSAVRELILERLPDGYEEMISGGMLAYAVPLARFAKTHNKQPLWYVALAGQKNYNSLYLMSVYGSKEHEQRLREGFARQGKKLDMGKSCIHFQRAEDLPLDVIGDIIASIPVDRWVSIYEASRRRPRS
jgi:uncharacterized protein DUF1801